MREQSSYIDSRSGRARGPPLLFLLGQGEERVNPGAPRSLCQVAANGFSHDLRTGPADQSLLLSS
jgi:hypothetical protein